MKLSSLPEEFEQLDHRVQELEEEIRNRADAVTMGRSAAGVYVDSIARIRAYFDQLDVALGYELLLSNQTIEENLPRLHTAFRMLEQLTTMQQHQIDGFLTCMGGPQVIAVQQVVEWAKGDAGRERLLAQVLAESVELAKRSRRRH